MAHLLALCQNHLAVSTKMFLELIYHFMQLVLQRKILKKMKD